MKLTLFNFLVLFPYFIYAQGLEKVSKKEFETAQANSLKFGRSCPDQSKISDRFDLKNAEYIKCESGKNYKITDKKLIEIDDGDWNNALSKSVSDTMDPYLKVCTFYTDQMMIDCPQGTYIRSDLINDPKIAPFLALTVKMENLDEYKEKRLKKMAPLDPRLGRCTYYTDKMMIDCPHATYVRSDLTKDEKIIQFIKNKKAYDDNDGARPPAGTSKD